MTERHDDFDERHRRAMEELAASSIPAMQYDPPLHRILRRLGVKLRPPHYQPQSTNVALFGVPFALLMALAAWLVPAVMGGASGALLMLLAGLAGAVFGWLMAHIFRRDANAAKLTRWNDLLSDGDTA